MKHYQFVSFGASGFQTHRFEIQRENEKELLDLASQFCEQNEWTLIAGAVLGGEDPLPGLRASLAYAMYGLGRDEQGGDPDAECAAIELLTGVLLLNLTEKQLDGLRRGVALAPDGTKCEDQGVLVVQLLPVWWNADGPDEVRDVTDQPRVVHVRTWGGYEEASDDPVGPQWLEFGGMSYRIPDGLVVGSAD